MAENFPLQVTLGALDRITAPLERIRGRIQRSLAPVGLIGDRLRSLGEAGGLPRLATAFGRVRSSIGDLGRAGLGVLTKLTAGTAAAVAGGFALARSYVAAGAQVARTAGRVGLGVVAFQELRWAAMRSGTEADAFNDSMLELSQRLGEAALGEGEGLEALRALGINATNAEGKLRPLEELLPVLADQLSQVSDEGVRNALAAKLFGDEGVSLVQILGQGSARLAELRAEARKFGAVIDQDAAEGALRFEGVLQLLGGAFEGIRNRIGARLLPVIESLAERFTGWLVDAQPRIEALADRIAAALPGVLEDLGEILADLAERAEPFLAFGRQVVRRFGPARTILAALAVVIGGPLVVAIVAALGALAAMGSALVATPFGLILLGVAAMAAAVAALILEWDQVAGFFRGVWEQVVGAFEWARDRMSSALEPVIEHAKELLRMLGLLEERERKPQGTAPNMLTPWYQPPPAALEVPEDSAAAKLRRMRAGAGGDGGNVLKIKFENMPAGARVEETRRSGDLLLDLEVGRALPGAR